MLLAIQSTEVAEQHQDGRTAKETAGGKDLTIECYQVEVEVDLHQNMMLSSRHRYVIRVTEEHALTRWNRGGRLVFH